MVGTQIDFINEKNEIIGEKTGALEHEEIVKKNDLSYSTFSPSHHNFRNHQNIKYREKFIYCLKITTFISI